MELALREQNLLNVTSDANKHVDPELIETQRRLYFEKQERVDQTYKLYLWSNFASFLLLFFCILGLRVYIIKKRIEISRSVNTLSNTKEAKCVSVRDFSLKLSNFPKNLNEKDIYSIAHYICDLANVPQPSKISCSLFFNDCLDNLLQIENLKTYIRELHYKKFQEPNTLAEINNINEKIKCLMTKVNDQVLVIRRKLDIPFEKTLNLFSFLNQPVTSIIMTLDSTESLNKLYAYYNKVSFFFNSLYIKSPI
jgi:hypothetical protein